VAVWPSGMAEPGPTPAPGRWQCHGVARGLVMTAAAGSVSTAVSVSVDMTEGIVNRFRTMAVVAAVALPAGFAQVVCQPVRQVCGSFAGVISPARRCTWECVHLAVRTAVGVVRTKRQSWAETAPPGASKFPIRYASTARFRNICKRGTAEPAGTGFSHTVHAV
jgi:hypothetical protein